MGEKIGLVLSGGGAKGAIEMGAWKKIVELGLHEKITGFSGASVGSLNTALFLSDTTMEEKENIWKNLRQEDLFSQKELPEEKYDASSYRKAPENDSLDALFSDIASMKPSEILDDALGDILHGVSSLASKLSGNYTSNNANYLLTRDSTYGANRGSLTTNADKSLVGAFSEGMFSQSGVENIIDSVKLSEEQYGKYDVFTSVTNLNTMKVEFIDWNNQYQFASVKDIILASSALPGIYAFKNVGGVSYADGGTLGHYGNTPIQPLYDKGYRKFIVIYLTAIDEDRVRIEEESKYPGAQFCRIYPKSNEYNKKETLIRVNEFEIEGRILFGEYLAGVRLIRSQFL